MSALGDLLDLQGLDTAVAQHVHRLTHLPEAAEVARLDAELRTLEATRGAAAEALAVVAARQADIEAELAATESRLRTVSDRLYGGSVSASRDLQAMTADVDSLRARASGLEDRVLEVLEEREPLDESLGAADAHLATLAEQRRAAEAARAVAHAEVEAELVELRARRQAAEAGIEPALLADYERLRARNGGVGAARLVGDRCGGCHLTLPAVELDRVRHSPEGSVQHCDECGRILVVR